MAALASKCVGKWRLAVQGAGAKFGAQSHVSSPGDIVCSVWVGVLWVLFVVAKWWQPYVTKPLGIVTVNFQAIVVRMQSTGSLQEAHMLTMDDWQVNI